MTLDFFAERDRLRALDRARHEAPTKEYGVRVAPSLAHGRVTGRSWGTDRPVRSAVSAQNRYSIDPHRALAWWARHGGDAA